jgi:hypothetical protein
MAEDIYLFDRIAVPTKKNRLPKSGKYGKYITYSSRTYDVYEVLVHNDTVSIDRFSVMLTHDTHEHLTWNADITSERKKAFRNAYGRVMSGTKV